MSAVGAVDGDVGVFLVKEIAFLEQVFDGLARCSDDAPLVELLQPLFEGRLLDFQEYDVQGLAEGWASGIVTVQAFSVL